MADTLVFSSARLRGFSRDANSGTAKFSSTISAAVQRALKWEDLPECYTGGKPEGQLHATEIEMAPDEDGLKRQKFKLATSSITKFEIVRLELEGKKSKGHRLELRFDVNFTDKHGADKLEKFMLVAGDCKSKLTATYVKQEEFKLIEEQQALDTAEDAD